MFPFLFDFGVVNQQLSDLLGFFANGMSLVLAVFEGLELELGLDLLDFVFELRQTPGCAVLDEVLDQVEGLLKWDVP